MIHYDDFINISLLSRARRCDIRKHSSQSALRIESRNGGAKVVSPGFLITHLLVVGYRTPTKSTGRVESVRGARSNPYFMLETICSQKAVPIDADNCSSFARFFGCIMWIVLKLYTVYLNHVFHQITGKTLPDTTLRGRGGGAGKSFHISHLWASSAIQEEYNSLILRNWSR